jgi:hypothetical protein
MLIVGGQYTRKHRQKLLVIEQKSAEIIYVLRIRDGCGLGVVDRGSLAS